MCKVVETSRRVIGYIKDSPSLADAMHGIQFTTLTIKDGIRHGYNVIRAVKERAYWYGVLELQPIIYDR